MRLKKGFEYVLWNICVSILILRHKGAPRNRYRCGSLNGTVSAIELLKSEIPKYIDKINFVHLCFTTDPFMHNQADCINLSLDLLKILNEEGIKCTALTKGILPGELTQFSKNNEYGITLVSVDEDFRSKYEPFTASYSERIRSLYHLHKNGFKTWISMEPYPTPNIVNQNLDDILDSISFVDKVIFGRLNYNTQVTQYPEYQQFYNDLCIQIIDFCNKEGKEFHIKKGTLKSLKSVCNSLAFLPLRPTESRI